MENDLIRRLKLSIAGFDRGEHVSTWVTWKLNQECVDQLIALQRELAEARGIIAQRIGVEVDELGFPLSAVKVKD